MTHDNHNACCTNQNILLPSFVGHKKRKTQQQRKKKKNHSVWDTHHIQPQPYIKSNNFSTHSDPWLLNNYL